MTSSFRCGETVHACAVSLTVDGDVVDSITPCGSRVWRGLVDGGGQAVEYDGPVVRLACERYLDGTASILLRRPCLEAVETRDDVDCMACIAAGCSRIEP